MKRSGTQLLVETLEHRRLLTTLRLSSLDSNGAIESDIIDPTVIAQNVDSIGDSFSDAFDIGSLTSDFKILERVGANDAVDVLRFGVTERQKLTLTLQTAENRIGMFVFDVAGHLIASGNRVAPGFDSVQREFASGDYYVLMLPHSGESLQYHFGIDLHNKPNPEVHQPPVNPPDASVDGANSFGTATVVSLPFSRTESLGGEDDADVFEINIQQDSNLQVHLSKMTADMHVYLFDKSGKLLGRNVKRGTESEEFERSVNAGDYYVLVLPAKGNVGTFQLDVSLLPTSNAGPDRNHADNDVQPAPDRPTAHLPVPLPSVSYFGSNRDWNINAVQAPEAWAKGMHGQGIVIAVLDTGVDRNHIDLRDNIWQNAAEVPGDGIDNDRNGYVDDVFGWNFEQGNADTRDANAHGTHIAGVLVAARNQVGTTGIAYGAKVMPVRVLDDSGFGLNSNVAKGIRYAVDQGADIINLSFIADNDTSMRSAIEYAQDHNVLIVAASGNESKNVPGFPARYSSQFSNVISVGAYNTSFAQSSFSNRVGNSNAVQVDAPGRSIYSTIPGNRYAYYKGTSMATPHVSGLAALALSSGNGLSVNQLRQVILDGAKQTVTGSDSKGGINAAYSVPMAFHRSSAAARIVGHAELDDRLVSVELRPQQFDHVNRRFAPNAIGLGRPAARMASLDSHSTFQTSDQSRLNRTLRVDSSEVASANLADHVFSDSTLQL